MAILSPTNLETADYGTVGWNAIYSSNFQKINDYFKRFDMSRYSLTFSSSVTYNCLNGNLQSLVLTGNTTISFSNGFAGAKLFLILKQDSTGGRNVSWGTMVRFLKGVDNKIDTTANSVTILGFVYNDIDGKYDCFLNSYGMSETEILNKLKTVDGSGSGLDADLLDGYNSSQTPAANAIPVAGSNQMLDPDWVFPVYTDALEVTNDKRIGVGTTSPNSKVHINGSVALKITSTDSNLTLGIDDCVILCNAGSNSITISLPDASGISGRIYTIKKIDSSTNNVTISAYGSQTIDGSNSYVLNSQYKYVTIISDGSNWYIIANN